MTRRRLLSVAVAAVLLILTFGGGAGADTGTSIFDNVAPKAQVGGLSQKYPSGRYGLDYHVSDVVDTATVDGGIAGALVGGLPGFFLGSGHDVEVPTGVDVSSMPALVMHAIASAVWDFTRLISNAVITLFTFAFSLDLINGAKGALAPVAAATNNLYTQIGLPWLPVLIVVLGIILAVRLLVKRDVVGTFGRLGVSMACVFCSMLLITQSGWTIGGVSHFSSVAANGVLGAVNGDDREAAKTAGADSLFQTLVHDPWVVLQFGGLEHCVDDSNRPVGPFARTCETKINHKAKYADRWLRGSPNGPARDLEYQAIRDGKLPDASTLEQVGAPTGYFDGYTVSAADRPAVDIQQQQIAAERVGYSVLVLLGSAGAWLLIGGTSFGAIVSQVMALFLFALAAFMLLLGLFPGPGHRAYRAWLERLLLALTKPLWYSLIIALVLALNNALTAATAQLGWLMAFGLKGAFNWAVFFKRKDLYNMLTRSLPGSTGAEQRERSAGDVVRDAYYATRMAAPALDMATSGVEKLGRRGVQVAKATGGAAQHEGRKYATIAGMGVDAATSAAGRRVGRGAANGHATAFVAAGALTGRAMDELESEHDANGRRVSAERTRRERLRDLVSQDRPLSDAEEREVSGLRGGLMDDNEYEGLTGRVNDVEQRRLDSDGQSPFTDEEISARAAEIAARDADARDAPAGTEELSRAWRAQQERDALHEQATRAYRDSQSGADPLTQFDRDFDAAWERDHGPRVPPHETHADRDRRHNEEYNRIFGRDDDEQPPALHGDPDDLRTAAAAAFGDHNAPTPRRRVPWRRSRHFRPEDR